MKLICSKSLSSYKAIQKVSSDNIVKNKNTIGL
jgi:hypothetical protein